METISSRTNQRILKTAKLQHAKYRKEYNQFLVEGIRSCIEFLQAQRYRCSDIFVTHSALEQHEQEFTPYSDHITVVSQPVMNKLSTQTTPSGIIGVFEQPKTQTPQRIEPGLVLANITNPGNMGTLIRTAVALQKAHIYVIDGVDIYNPKVIQSTAGTLAHAHVYTISWDDLVAHKQRPNLIALVVSGGTAPQNISEPGLLVVGNEAHGISDKHLEQCEQKMTLPMPGHAESLNAAVAGSIALYLSVMPKLF